MRKAALIILCLFAFIPAAQLSAAWKVVKIGDYPIVGTVRHKGFILDDGNIYKPVSANQRQASMDWELGDSIMLLKARGKNRFILVNSRTGQKAIMRNVSW
jgi:hypothetical protein